MNTSTDLTTNETPTLPDLGYYLHPAPASPNELPHGMHLYVTIQDEPTDAHFDPVSLRALVANKDGGVETVVLGLGSPDDVRQVCMGRIVLHDRLHKSVHFFTFGGKMTVTRKSTGQECTAVVFDVASSAPILSLNEDQRNIDNQLADELGSSLACLQAAWGNSDASFGARLAQLDPMHAFIGGLVELHDRYAHAKAVAHEFPKLAAFLRQEQTLLTAAGLWTDASESLGQLLAPEGVSPECSPPERTSPNGNGV